MPQLKKLFAAAYANLVARDSIALWALGMKNGDAASARLEREVWRQWEATGSADLASLGVSAVRCTPPFVVSPHFDCRSVMDITTLDQCVLFGILTLGSVPGQYEASPAMRLLTAAVTKRPAAFRDGAAFEELVAAAMARGAAAAGCDVMTLHTPLPATWLLL